MLSGNHVFASASASAEIAMEQTTGKVLEESNADSKLPMASTTKIMTAIIIIEDCNLDDIITVPDEAVGVEGSSIFLKKDEKIDIRDLLYGLMMRSGNDSATALAIYHSGTVDDFVDKMNDKAREIGALSTNFKNPSGLPDKEHYTTARDLCNIARYAMSNEFFKEIVSSKSYSGKYRNYTNKNKMLFNYEGANGVKTGYTVKAGRCLVSSAERNGMQVVSVVLNCPDMYERSENILDYCFNNYALIEINPETFIMSDKVLYKTQERINFVANKAEKLFYKVKNILSDEKRFDGDYDAELEIYSGNNLILVEKLYNI